MVSHINIYILFAIERFLSVFFTKQDMSKFELALGKILNNIKKMLLCLVGKYFVVEVHLFCLL